MRRRLGGGLRRYIFCGAPCVVSNGPEGLLSPGVYYGDHLGSGGGILPPGVAWQLHQALGRRKVVRQGAGQLEDELPETMTLFETPLDGLCLFQALARVWNEMHPQDT